MYTPEEIVETYEMISLQHLNIRTITVGINLLGCLDRDLQRLKSCIYRKVVETALRLNNAVREVEAKYGVEIVNRRIAVTPIAILLEPFAEEGDATKIGLELATALDDAAEEGGIDYIGGYSALVHKGFTKGDLALIQSIPEVLSSTERVCSCVNIASTRTGINVDAALKMGEVIKKTSELTADRRGVGCAKLVTFTNAPEDNPFMPGAYHGLGEPEVSVNVGISGPAVIKAIVEKNQDLDLRQLADLVKRTAFKVTRVGELLGREVAKLMGVHFSTVDLSLAPTPKQGESIANILEAMGLERCGAPGTTAALMLLTDAVKKGGSMATTFVGGLSGAFIPVSEDAGMVEAVKAGALSLEKLEAMTAVCSAGLDMIAVPGDTSAETLAGIILDEAAICVANDKPGGVRIIPVPGAKAGDYVEFGGLLGSTIVMEVKRFKPDKFVRRGGQIPAPIHSFRG
jgi:uncharacterized protein (UPF0210 family)